MHIDTDEANATELSKGNTGGDLLYQSPESAAAASLSRKRTK